MRFLFGIFLLAMGIGIVPLMAQNQKASDKASETGMIIPAGTIMPYAGSTAPAGWVFAAGQEYNTTGTYAKLYAAIGTMYCTNDHGAGGTCTTGVFRVPDMRGRFVGGKDNMNGIAANRITSAKTLDGTILGKAGGSQNIAGHYHGHSLATSIGVTGGTASLTGTTTFSSTGHNHQWFNAGAQTYNSSGGGISAPIGPYSSGVAGQAIRGDASTDMYTANGGGSATVGISSTPASITGSNSVTGSIGLISGGCDGNSDSCNNLSPTIILNYIIKI